MKNPYKKLVKTGTINTSYNMCEGVQLFSIKKKSFILHEPIAFNDA